MKKFYTLLKLEYNSMFLPACTLMSITALLEIILFGTMLNNANKNIPLAYLIDKSGIPVVFAISFLALLALTVLRFLQSFYPSKSIYALLSLPLQRSYIYYAKLISSLSVVLCLIAMQLLLLIIAVYAYDHFLISLYSPIYTEANQNAVLYLTLLHSQFLRLIFPPDMFSLLFSISGFIGAVCFTLSASAQVKAGNIRHTVFIGAVWLLLLLVTFPLTDYKHLNSIIKLILLIIFPFTVSSSGIKAFRSGEVAG